MNVHIVYILYMNIMCGFSENAKEALELSKLQEQTRQAEFNTKAKEYEAAMEQARV